MPTGTLPKTSTNAPATPTDVRSLAHLHGHPEVASLLRKQHGLRERLTAVAQAIQTQCRDIAVLEEDTVMTAANFGGPWQPSPTLQDARQELAALLDEQRTLQAALP